MFSTVIEANYVEKHENMFAAYKLTDEDKEEMHRLARHPRIGACFACCCMRPRATTSPVQAKISHKRGMQYNCISS